MDDPGSLAAIAHALFPEKDTGTKADDYYRIYEPHFAPIRDRPLSIVELGVLEGKSTKVLATYFRHSHLLALDLQMQPIDFSQYHNVTYARCDQNDRAGLAEMCARTFPSDIDLVIDDAAHIGAYSLNSFLALFALLRPGGLYVIEDWGTGYWNDWPDGKALKSHGCSHYRKGLPRRITSHDFGMVGLIKLLVDYVAGPDVRPAQGAPKTRPSLIDMMEIHFGTVVLRKADIPAGETDLIAIRRQRWW